MSTLRPAAIALAICGLALVQSSTAVHAQEAPVGETVGPPTQPPPPPLLQHVDPMIAHEQTLRSRLDYLREEQVRLTRLGRPEHFYRRRLGGWLGLGLGLGSVVAVWAVWTVDAGGGFGPHSGESEPSSRNARISYATGLCLGIVSAGTGIWALKTANQENPYREQVAAMALEQRDVTRALKEARRERKHQRRYGAAPALSFDRGPRVVMNFVVKL
jgi:hypothetical protein